MEQNVEKKKKDYKKGAYPDSLDYLKKHYGITWDESKYKVTYEIIAKNIRPEVKVIPLQESKK